MMQVPRRHTEVIAEALKPRGRQILEIGCGDGVLLAWLRREGAAAIGLESDRAQLRRAASRVGPDALVAGLGQALPIATAALDAVLYFNSFHHLPPLLLHEGLVEAARVLRPQGDLLVIEPLATGDYFELMRPIEDETEMRAAAERALAKAPALGFRSRSRLDYPSLVRRASAVATLEALVAADPRRKAALVAAGPAVEAAFARLGEPAADGGRSFVQPMRLHHLERSPGEVDVAVAYGADRAAAFAIRREVFVVGQGVPLDDEFDTAENEAEHVLARNAGRAVGTLRCRPYGPSTWKIERVAVTPEARGRGVAGRMLDWLLVRLDGRGVAQTVLHAQLRARSLYERLGFVAEGDVFMEDGIAHQRMRRDRPSLGSAPPQEPG